MTEAGGGSRAEGPSLGKEKAWGLGRRERKREEGKSGSGGTAVAFDTLLHTALSPEGPNRGCAP